MTMTEYKRQKNADLLAVAQHPDVQAAAKAILARRCRTSSNTLYWSMDPEEKDAAGAYYRQNLLDHAHALCRPGARLSPSPQSQPPER